MAVIRPRHEHILGGILSNVFDIVSAAVARNIKAVGLEKIVRQLSSFSSSLNVFEDPGNPLSRRFDETKAQPGECFRQLTGNYRVAGSGGICRHAPETGAVTDTLAHHVNNIGVGVADMHAYR